MNPEHLQRQMDLVPMEILDTPVTIIGAGAIGSWTTLALAKMGFMKIRVFDFDQVDEVNLNCQFFPMDSIGRNKVDVLKEMVTTFTGTDIETVAERFSSGNVDDVLISAVDSLDVRKMIFASQESSALRYLIDPRMGGESAALYTVDMSDSKSRERYKNTLQGEPTRERCTAKATIYTANMLSGLVAKQVRDVLRGDSEFPHKISWDIQMNRLKAYCDKTTDIVVDKSFDDMYTEAFLAVSRG